MSLVDAYAVLAHTPILFEAMYDEALLMPVRVEESLLQSVQGHLALSQRVQVTRTAQGAHPFLLSVSLHAPLAMIGVVRASEAPEAVRAEAIVAARRQGAYIERFLVGQELVVMPWWQPKDATMAEEMGVSTEPSPDFHALTDQDFPATEVEIADRGSVIELRRAEVLVLDLKDYLATFQEPPFDRILVSILPDSAPHISAWDLTDDAKRKLRDADLDRTAKRLPLVMNGPVVLSPSVAHDDEGRMVTESSFWDITRTLAKHRTSLVPMTLRQATCDARPRLGRLFLAPGLYPLGWTSGGPRAKTPAEAWAIAVQVYEHYGVELPQEIARHEPH